MPGLLTVRINEGVGALVGDNDVQRVVVRGRHGYFSNSGTLLKLVKACGYAEGRDGGSDDFSLSNTERTIQPTET